MTRILVSMDNAPMKTLSLSEAKSKLSGLVEEVERRDEEVVITKNGRPAAVLVSPDENDSWKETLAVRSDQGLVRDIKAGLAAFKTRKARLYTLDELFK
jgi:prevent-host-death family protein